MSASHKLREAENFGLSFIASTVTHLAVFLLLAWAGKLLPALPEVKQTYYVDVVNLPVASPQQGTAAPNSEGSELPVDGAMTSVRPHQPSRVAPASGKKGAVANEEGAFTDRISSLKSKAEERQHESALEALRRKVSGNRVGMPAGSGVESGSDYTAYLHSRLKDAFRETISYNSKTPEMVVRLFIDSEGHISRTVTERSSGDRAFDLSVTRAITIASAGFPPPPSGKPYEGAFVFRPQGIQSQKNVKP